MVYRNHEYKAGHRPIGPREIVPIRNPDPETPIRHPRRPPCLHADRARSPASAAAGGTGSGRLPERAALAAERVEIIR